MLFAGYLFFQGVFRIGAICPFCFLIWITMPLMFWYTTLYNLRHGHFKIAGKVGDWLQKHHLDIIAFGTFCFWHFAAAFLVLLENAYLEYGQA